LDNIGHRFFKVSSLKVLFDSNVIYSIKEYKFFVTACLMFVIAVLYQYIPVLIILRKHVDSNVTQYVCSSDYKHHI